MQEFHMMIEKLLVRAKGDRTDSIRIEAQQTIRFIIRDLGQAEELENIQNSLTHGQIETLK